MAESIGARVAALLALLLLEYLALSVSFDARALHELGGSLGWFGYVGDLATGAIVGAAAVIGLSSRRVLDAVRELPASATRFRLWGALHLAAYVGLYGLSARVFGAAQAGEVPAPIWLIAWSIAVVTVLATWVLLAVPFAALVAARRRIGAAMLIGVGAGALAWGAGKLAQRSWAVLEPITFRAVSALLRMSVGTVVADPANAILGTTHFRVEIGPKCSGIEGIGLMIIFLGGYFALERKRLRFPAVLWLMPAAIVAAWCANAVRVALLILMGHWVSPSLAIGGFHSKAGWVFFCALALAFVVIAQRFERQDVARAPRTDAPHADPDVLRAYLVPMLLSIAIGLLTGLFVNDFDLFYPLRMMGVAGALWIFRSHYRSLWIMPSWQAVAIGLLVAVIWYALAGGADQDSIYRMQSELANLGVAAQIVWLVARAAGSSLVVPMIEELAFRGYLLPRLVSADFVHVDTKRVHWLAIIVSSVAFGFLHGDVIAATLAGLCYAFALQRRGQLIDAIAAHAVTNFVIALDAVFLGNLQHWA